MLTGTGAATRSPGGLRRDSPTRCDAGNHPFSSTSIGKVHFIKQWEETNRFGDDVMKSEEWDICEPHAKNLFRNQTIPDPEPLAITPEGKKLVDAEEYDRYIKALETNAHTPLVQFACNFVWIGDIDLAHHRCALTDSTHGSYGHQHICECGAYL